MGAVRIASTSLTRAVRPVAALALGGLVLTGCADGMSGSTAAVVDGQIITVQEVQQATSDFNELPVTPVNPSDVLTLMIYRDAVAEAYSEMGAPPIPEDQLITALQQGGGVADPSEPLVDLYRTLSHMQAVGQPDTADMEIKVNPRFGTWDPDAAQVMAETPDWITDVTTAEGQN